MTFRLRDADGTLRSFLTMFILVLTLGYGVGLFFVEHTTSFSTRGVEEQFLGNEGTSNVQEMRFSKSTNDMYVFVHNHVLSLALVFFAVGSIFYFSSIVNERLKRFLLIEPLAAIITTFGGIALVRFVSPAFSWLVILSGLSLFVCYCTIVVLIMKELWLGK